MSSPYGVYPPLPFDLRWGPDYGQSQPSFPPVTSTVANAEDVWNLIAHGDARLTEVVQDIVAAMLVAGTSNVGLAYNDPVGKLAISVTSGATTPPSTAAGFGTAPFATTPFGGSS